MKLLIAIILCAQSFVMSQSLSRLGGLPGAPLRMGFGAEGMGFANAFTATPNDAIVGYYNPALVPFQARPTVLASVGFLPLDRSLNFVSFSRSLPPSAGVSLALLNSGVSEIDGRDSDGRPTQSYSTSENAFLLSFGLMVHPSVAIGISTKILYYRLYTDISSTTVGFDFGAAVVLTTEWTLGLSVQDIGSKYKWDTSKLYGLNGNATTDFFPVRKKIGVSYRPQEIPGMASSEIEFIARTVLLRVGLQFSPHEQFTIRGGLDQYNFSENVAAKPTIGFSTNTNITTFTALLSYAYVFEPYSPGGIHMISIGAQFP